MGRVLVVKFGALGDVVRTSYFMQNLAEQHASVDWLTADASFDLLRYNPFVKLLATPSLRLSDILSQEYSKVYSLDDDREILEIVSQLKTQSTVGAFIDDEGTIQYSDDSSEWFDMGLISKFGKTIADSLKIQNTRSHSEIFQDIFKVPPAPAFFNSAFIEQQIKAKFYAEDTHFNIGLNTGAGGRWPSKELPIERTVLLVRKLLKETINNKPVRLMLLGGPNERERNTYIRETIQTPLLIDTGSSNSILEFSAIIKHLNLMISSDSLALHLAICQGIPSIAFFAPTSAVEIDMFGRGIKVHSTAPDYCSYRKDADNSTITVERIMIALQELMQDSSIFRSPFIKAGRKIQELGSA